jgi:O-antigen ligase
MALFTGISFLSGIVAYDKSSAFRESLQFFWLFTIYFLIFNLLKHREKVIDIFLVSILGGIIVSIIGIYQHFFVSEPFHFIINENRLRAYGTFGQPNAFGAYLAGIIPISIGLSLYIRRPLYKIAAVISGLLLSLSFVSTFSRGSWIGLFCGLALMFFFTKNKRFKVHLICSVSILLLSSGIIFGSMYAARSDSNYKSRTSFLKAANNDFNVKQTLQGAANNDFNVKQTHQGALTHSFSDRQRLLLAKSAFEMAKDHWLLGVGAGNYSKLLADYASDDLIYSSKIDYDTDKQLWYINPHKKIDIRLVHNVFLQIATELGIVGFTAFLWLLYRYFKVSIKLIRHDVDPLHAGLRTCLVGSFTAIIASGMFGWPFSHGIQEILIVVMALSVSPWGKFHTTSKE